MRSKEKQIALARVLIALAWADGEISIDEMNFLKDFMFKFDFTGEEWAQVEMYLEEPIPSEERDALILDLFQKLGSHQDRREFLTFLEKLTQADGMVSEEEREFLAQFTSLLQQSPSAKVLLNQVRGLFRKTVFRPVQGSNRSEELHAFVNNRILFKLKRKMERERLTLEADPEKLAYATLFGGLLACVASVHASLNEKELNTLKDHLRQISDFGDEAVELILSVIQETTKQGLDRFRLNREFYEKSSVEQRLQLLDCLFDIAGSDKDLRHDEVEEVRAIAYSLKLSHKDFIQSKLKSIEKGRESK